MNVEFKEFDPDKIVEDFCKDKQKCNPYVSPQMKELMKSQEWDDLWTHCPQVTAMAITGFCPDGTEYIPIE